MTAHAVSGMRASPGLDVGAAVGFIRRLFNDIAAIQFEPPAACWAQHRQWHGQTGWPPCGFEIGAVVRAHHEVHLLQDTPHRDRSSAAVAGRCSGRTRLRSGRTRLRKDGYEMPSVHQHAIGIGRRRESALTRNVAFADCGGCYGPGRQRAVFLLRPHGARQVEQVSGARLNEFQQRAIRELPWVIGEWKGRARQSTRRPHDYQAAAPRSAIPGNGVNLSPLITPTRIPAGVRIPPIRIFPVELTQYREISPGCLPLELVYAEDGCRFPVAG